MSRSTDFQSPLADGIRRCLAAKRAIARRYRTEEAALRLLDRFLVAQAVARGDQLTAEVLDAFLASRPRTRPRSFNHLLGVVRRCLDWLVGQGVLPGSPLRARPRRATARRVPFLFEPPQARRLLEAAGRLPDHPKGPGRGPTYRGRFALLYGLGLRVGEACRLQCGEVDLERALLLVQGAKFGQSRLVPCGPRMAHLLRDHLARRARDGAPPAPQAPLFTFDGRRGIHPGSVSRTFRQLVGRLDLAVPAGTAPPRLHDLRHNAESRIMLSWSSVSRFPLPERPERRLIYSA